MNSNQQLLAATLLALGMTTVSATLFAADSTDDTKKVEMEHCAGIVKAGMNDCAANGHACAGQAKAESDAKEFIALPKGTCEKITGGVVLPKAM